jgi:hypothetical protein
VAASAYRLSWRWSESGSLEGVLGGREDGFINPSRERGHYRPAVNALHEQTYTPLVKIVKLAKSGSKCLQNARMPYFYARKIAAPRRENPREPICIPTEGRDSPSRKRECNV